MTDRLTAGGDIYVITGELCISEQEGGYAASAIEIGNKDLGDWIMRNLQHRLPEDSRSHGLDRWVDYECVGFVRVTLEVLGDD